MLHFSKHEYCILDGHKCGFSSLFVVMLVSVCHYWHWLVYKYGCSRGGELHVDYTTIVLWFVLSANHPDKLYFFLCYSQLWKMVTQGTVGNSAFLAQWILKLSSFRALETLHDVLSDGGQAEEEHKTSILIQINDASGPSGNLSPAALRTS